MLDEQSEDDLTSLPATMSDIFFSLVAVVIVMLLSLAPAIRMPGALATQKADVMTSPILVDGQPPAIFVAEADGLRIGQQGQLVPLDAILADAGVAEALSAAEQDILLVVAEGGQEAAFLFNSLAGMERIGTILQLRLDPGCRYIADPARVGCQPVGASL